MDQRDLCKECEDKLHDLSVIVARDRNKSWLKKKTSELCKEILQFLEPENVKKILDEQVKKKKFRIRGLHKETDSFELSTAREYSTNHDEIYVSMEDFVNQVLYQRNQNLSQMEVESITKQVINTIIRM